ncbi:MAG TPA: hypothetical protein VEG67_05770 [Myxococcota bacterium]|nr:hypothetical protein [Myxococcota bacterium]
MDGTYKVCPSCEGEYLPTVEVCPDCRVPLVAEGEPRKTRGESELVLPPGEGLVVIREAELAWAVGLGEALAAAGIPHRLDPPGTRPGSSARWAVRVAEADAPRAAALDADHARRELPQLAEDTPGSAASEDRCPGCGEPLAGDAGECTECGLVFGPAS